MASLDLVKTWTIKIENVELLLIRKALTGRLRPEEIASAKELGNYLGRVQAGVLKSAAESAEKLLHNIEQETEQ